MSRAIRVISSMATRRLLADLVAAYGQASPDSPVSVESTGGVEAARRVAAGEPFDAVVLAAGAIDALAAQGRIRPESRVALVASPVAVAVRAGAPRPSIDTEGDVRRAVVAARTIGYSTGPSGDHLTGVFQRWGVADAVKERLVQAPPGTPVAGLVARGDVELGFQQLSELLGVEGIDILGLLPAAIQNMTTFTAGITAACAQPDATRALLAYLASPGVAAIKRNHGMEPA